MTTFIIILVVIVLIVLIITFCLSNFIFNIALKPGFKKDVVFKSNSSNDEKDDIPDDIELENIEHAYIFSKERYRLHSEIIVNNNSDVFVILIHGYGGNSTKMHARAKMFLDRGYSVVMPDLRTFGKSEGKYIGMGWPDRLDIVKWINYINDNYKNKKIVLYGVSMGAATVMMTLGETLPENVKVAIEDCGYASLKEQFEYELKKVFNLPKFPIYYIVDRMCKRHLHFTFEEASAIKQLKKSSVPILFIHGQADTFVPPYMAKEAYDSTVAQKEILLVPNATHTKSSKIYGNLYWNKVFNFIDKYIK